MKSSSAEIKANLIRAILGGEIQVFLGEEKSLDLLELDRTDAMKFLKQQRLKYKGNCCMGLEAAERIQCSFDIIVSLVALGLLIGKKENSNWRISSESVERFRGGYWPISVLASAQKTSSRRIQDICLKNGIELLAVSLHNARSKLYARIADRPRINRLLEAPAHENAGLLCSEEEQQHHKYQ